MQVLNEYRQNEGRKCSAHVFSLLCVSNRCCPRSQVKALVPSVTFLIKQGMWEESSSLGTSQTILSVLLLTVKNREEIEGTHSGEEAHCVQIQESVEKCLCSGYSYVPSQSFLPKALLACATLKKKKKSTHPHCKSCQYSQLGHVFLILDIHSLTDANLKRVYSHTK